LATASPEAIASVVVDGATVTTSSVDRATSCGMDAGWLSCLAGDQRRRSIFGPLAICNESRPVRHVGAEPRAEECHREA